MHYVDVSASYYSFYVSKLLVTDTDTPKKSWSFCLNQAYPSTSTCGFANTDLSVSTHTVGTGAGDTSDNFVIVTVPI